MLDPVFDKETAKLLSRGAVHSYQQWMRDLVASHPLCHLVLSLFFSFDFDLYALYGCLVDALGITLSIHNILSWCHHFINLSQVWKLYLLLYLFTFIIVLIFPLQTLRTTSDTVKILPQTVKHNLKSEGGGKCIIFSIILTLEIVPYSFLIF